MKYGQMMMKVRVKYHLINNKINQIKVLYISDDYIFYKIFIVISKKGLPMF